ncbi:MAG: tRNA CCA-pyrophosphorylase [Buchnera aphidicola (Meitanaphis microgallis)]
MKIYLVGGAIRDRLLHIPVRDRDWVVVGATPETLLSLNFKKVGKSFPVFLHPDSKEEYSLARIDRKFGVGYTGFKTDYSNKVTLEEDLMRRDLTINAIAQDINGNYIDFFGGLKDLKNKILRHVSPAFCEDPLRILRVARFSASLNHFGFQIAQETMQLMIDMVKNKELLSLTKDRIWKETEKALKTRNLHVYFQVLYSCNALSIIFPEINLAYRCELQRIMGYYQKVCFRSNIFLEIAKISNLNEDIDIKFTYLCNIVCQFITFDINYFFLSMRNIIAKKLIKILCNRLHIPSYIKDLSIIFVEHCNFLSLICIQSSESIMIFFKKIDAWRKPDRIKKLSLLIDLYMLNFLNMKSINICQGNFLKRVFDISNNISIKPIIYAGFIGIEIRRELVRLRTIAIDKGRRDSRCL